MKSSKYQAKTISSELYDFILVSVSSALAQNTTPDGFVQCYYDIMLAGDSVYER